MKKVGRFLYNHLFGVTVTAIVVTVAIMVFVTLLSADGRAAVMAEVDKQQAALAVDNSRFVYTDTTGNEHIFVDTQTGVNYLVIYSGYGRMLTPLYNADGSLIVTEVPNGLSDYCHPFSSCERGSNERANRIIRRFFPKGKTLKPYTQKDCDRAAASINSMHRRILDYATAEELFNQELEALKTTA